MTEKPLSPRSDKANPEVRLADETVTYLRDQMRDAVAEGISAAMTDEAAERFWNTGLTMLRQQATVHTGRFVLDGIWTLAKKLFWVAIFIGALYAVGGWSAIKAVGGAIAQAISKS